MSAESLTARNAPPDEPWAPPEIIAENDPSAGQLCPLLAVLDGASSRVRELGQNLARFTATEQVTHSEWKRSREWSKPVQVRFQYMAQLEKYSSGFLHISELRDADDDLRKFPGGLATLGLPAMVMIFDPVFSSDYLMTCEGRSEWHGRPAWVVYFQQRPDRAPRMRAYTVKGIEYLLKLKGRAWLDASSFQVMHLETDLMQPVSQISLFRDHVSLDYEPVHFQKDNEDLWLQKRAEVYLDFQGHRFHRTHEFSNFLLFSVDVGTKDKVPNPE